MDYTSWIFAHPPEDVNTAIFIDADEPNRSISWQQYATEVKRVSVGMREHGLLDQECVALVAPNDIYFSSLGDGVIAAGGIFTGFAPDQKQSEMASACDAAQVKWLFAIPPLLEHTRRVAKDAGIPDSRVAVYDPPGVQSGARSIDPNRLRLSHLLQDYDEKDFVNANTSKDPSEQILARLFTSGTTGAPKAAEVSHAAQIARTKCNRFDYPEDGSVKYLHFIGMHHISGSVNRNKASAGYQRMHVTKMQQPSQIAEMIQRLQIEAVVFPPRSMTALSELIRRGVCSKEQIASLRYTSVGGSQVPNEAMDNFKAYLSPECDLKIAYGSTELGMYTYGSWEKPNPIECTGYVGRVSAETDAKTIDPETLKECDSNTPGEIIGKGTQLFSGYCGNQKATDSAFLTDDEGGRWFRSGDKGRLSAEQQLTVIGRYKEIFKVDTEEVAPAEVELVLTRHAGVKDAAVVATQDRNDSRYYEVKAYIVPDEKNHPTAQELVDFVAAELTPHKAPTGGVTMLKEIPRNPMKKVVTRQLESAEQLPGSMGYMNVLKN